MGSQMLLRKIIFVAVAAEILFFYETEHFGANAPGTFSILGLSKSRLILTQLIFLFKFW